ncbi:MAG TPA: DUF2285 domain-containing protein [Sphingomonadaceae bacterium]|nr:DUF2285 domain-containing protein [Sphingomonadaceae bacterium]
MIESEPAIADEAPCTDRLTSYDEARLILYLRLLDAEAEGADWREVARVVLRIDATAEPERARRCWDTHLKRAQWIAESCYNRLTR